MIYNICTTVLVSGNQAYQPLGCYRDKEDDRDFANVKFLGQHNNIQDCVNFCVVKGKITSFYFCMLKYIVHTCTFTKVCKDYVNT